MNERPITNIDLYLLRTRMQNPGGKRPGVTQIRMAQILGISVPMYSLYELGKAPINQTVQKLARLLLKEEQAREAREMLEYADDSNHPNLS